MLVLGGMLAHAGPAYAGGVTEDPAEVAKRFETTSTWPQEADVPGTAQRDQPLSPQQKSTVQAGKMPTLGPGEYGTDTDNEDNANTHAADGDMDVYLYNTDAISPIEFNITLPAGSAGKPATLRMDVYDVDASSGEVDNVYVNGVKVGSLNGKDSTWGVNIFSVPSGVLVDGRNLVRVDIDTKHPGGGVWAVQINWGIIALNRSTAAPNIARCWVAPAVQSAGDYVNFYAELTNKVDAVKVSIGGKTLVLSDPDGDNVWSASWRIPTTLVKKTYPFSMAAYKASKIVSTCPSLKVTN